MVAVALPQENIAVALSHDKTVAVLFRDSTVVLEGKPAAVVSHDGTVVASKVQDFPVVDAQLVVVVHALSEVAFV